MDLTALENKLNRFNPTQPFSPVSTTQSTTQSNTQSNTQSKQQSVLTANNPFTNSTSQSTKKRAQQNTSSRPVSITRKINEISDEDVASYSEKNIPNWRDLQTIYEGRWNKEKEKFQTHLKANFAALVERYASGKQELFQLCAPERREKLYVEAFLELFESGYAPHVGDVERIAGKRTRKLHITLPHNYSSIY
jgi:hypothetical protein